VKHISVHVCIVLLLLLSVTAGALAAESTTGQRPTIGLALSGGGARGAAHIGVLRVLEEQRIPIDYIAATSMGALVGGLYASGMTPAELEELISQIDWADAFSDKISRVDRSFRRKRDDDLYLVKHRPGISGNGLAFPPGILDGQKIDLLLKKYSLHVSTIRDFDELPIPFRAVATDIETGEAYVIGRGDLALALRASMSIPAFFAPREIDGRLLVDGGVSSNLPIDVVRRMGADIVIAVDIGTPLSKREEIESVLDITGQVTNILTRRNADEQIASLRESDIFIQPDLGDITTASFDRAGEAVPIGFEAAEAVLNKLQPLSVSKDEYSACLEKQRVRQAPSVIDEVRIVNRSRLADDVIASRVSAEPGTPLDIPRLERDLGQLHGLNIFESVYYDVTAGENAAALTITAQEASWGPNYLQFGAAVFEDFEGPNFNIAAAYTRTAMNGWNGEWRTHLQIGQEPGVFTELFQPVGSGLKYFIHLQTSILENAENVFDSDGKNLMELGIRRYGGSVAAGRELGTWGELRAGIRREGGTIKIQVGDPSTPERDFDTGEGFLQVHADELDNVNFPHSGFYARARISAGLSELGSDIEYEQQLCEGALAWTRRRFTGLLGGFFATTRDSDAPYPSLFRMGGFMRLSGLQQNERRGQHAALLSGVIYRQIADLSLLSVYAGFSVEYGNAVQRQEDIKLDNGIAAGSLFVGLDTLLGPIYLAYGHAEGGRKNFYFILGQSFGGRHTAFGGTGD
jgi:NTE family protein